MSLKRDTLSHSTFTLQIIDSAMDDPKEKFVKLLDVELEHLRRRVLRYYDAVAAKRVDRAA